MGTVAYLPVDVDRMTPEQTLEDAKSVNYREVIVIGTDVDNCIIHRHSHMTRRDALWLAQHLLKYALGDD